LPVFLGSPDHFALRLRKWRLSTAQTVRASWAAAVALGALAIAMMLAETPVALGILAGIALASIALALFLRRIDMTL